MFSKEIWKISQERYFKTNYGFWRNLSYWRWMRWCVVWSRRKSKYNTWLWFVLRFSSRTRAGNEDFIVIFGGTKSSGIFFLKKQTLWYQSFTAGSWPLSALMGVLSNLQLSTVTGSLQLLSQSGVPLRRGTETCLQTLCIIQVRIWFWFTLWMPAYSRVLRLVLCVFVCFSFPIYN